MTDTDVHTLKGVVKALAELRRSDGAVPSEAQAAELATLGERAATDALLCILGVGVLTADHGASYLGYICIKIAHLLADAHPQQPTPAQVLQMLAGLAAAANASAPIPALTSPNTTDQGKN